MSLHQEWYGVESTWGALSEDEHERTRLLEVLRERLAERTMLSALARKKQIVLNG